MGVSKSTLPGYDCKVLENDGRQNEFYADDITKQKGKKTAHVRTLFIFPMQLKNNLVLERAELCFFLFNQQFFKLFFVVAGTLVDSMSV